MRNTNKRSEGYKTRAEKKREKKEQKTSTNVKSKRSGSNGA